MAALTDKRMNRWERFSSIELGGTASEAYFQGGVAGIDTATGLVTKYQANTTLIPIGTFAENGTVPAGGGTVLIKLFKEHFAIWMVNGAGADEVLSSDIGQLVYGDDDQTVSLTSQTATLSLFGRVWKVDATKGVLVEPVTPTV